MWNCEDSLWHTNQTNQPIGGECEKCELYIAFVHVECEIVKTVFDIQPNHPTNIGGCEKCAFHAVFVHMKCAIVKTVFYTQPSRIGIKETYDLLFARMAL